MQTLQQPLPEMWESRLHFEELLCLLFDEASIRRWLRLRPEGEIVASLLPGPPLAFRELVHSAVDIMLRRGLVSTGLFEELARDFPYRSAEIRSVLALWHRSRPRGAPCPSPTPAHVEIIRLSDELDAAYQHREECVVTGVDTAEIDTKILELRRQLRRGPQLQSGEFLDRGRYRLVELLGRGGFATVWKAYDRDCRELVAIKVLHGQWSEDRTTRERFARGARTMAHLSHPAIIRVRSGLSDQDGFYFYVMPLASSGDLRAAVLAGLVDVKASVEIAITICEALKCGHEAGVVHRDVKPSNILLHDGLKPWLTDFDLVKSEHTTGGTLTGGMGSLFYTAPEVMRDASRADARADVYGVGMALLYCIRRCEPDLDLFMDLPRNINGLAVPDEMKAALVGALQRDVDVRTPDCATLGLALATALRAMDRGSSNERKFDDSKGNVGTGQTETRALSFGSHLDSNNAAKVHLSVIPVPAAGSLWVEPITSMRFVYVPAGRFQMGSEGIDSATLPVHAVRLSAFWLGEVPVTNAQYAKFLEANRGRREPKFWRDERFCGPRQPVVGVDWEDAQAFCAWLSEVAKVTAKLPSEAQWEYAARGPEGRRFPWGSELPDSTRAGFKASGASRTFRVGMFPRGRGAFGALDQAGNVWEWCDDVWNPRAYDRTVDPLDPINGAGDPEYRAVRGGSWYNDAETLAAAGREKRRFRDRLADFGFRVLVSSGPLERGLTGLVQPVPNQELDTRRKLDRFLARISRYLSPADWEQDTYLATDGHKTIRVLRGDIRRHHADAIVCGISVRGGSGPLAAQLVAAGGPSPGEGHQTRGPLASGDIIVCPGKGLPCEHVLYAVQDLSFDGVNRLLATQIRLIVDRSLQIASSLGAVNVAFPALFTGKLSNRRPEVLRLLFESLLEFLPAAEGVVDAHLIIYAEPHRGAPET